MANRILAWAEAKGLWLWWGKGKQDGSFFPLVNHLGNDHWLVSVWTYGRVEIQFQQMMKKPPFDDEAERLELLRRLNEIPGVNISPDGITRRPSIPLSALKDEATLGQFLVTLEWVVNEIKASSL